MSSADLAAYYDRVPYHSGPISVIRPENMEMVAHLSGHRAAPMARARILEIGGASGGNTIPFALRFPQAHCVVMDISGEQIRAGQSLIAQCGGLPNVELRQASVTDIDSSWGQFDYIVCHGVFSWVPDPVRSDILRVCRENLAPNGVAMVSFNALPGWKARGTIRDAMLLLTDPDLTPEQRLEQAKSTVRSLQPIAKDNALLGAGLNEVLPLLESQRDSYLLHEFMEPFNTPFYLKEVVELAQAAGLTYLGDTAIGTLYADNYPQEMQDVLAAAAPATQVGEQQLLDFLVSRNFRQSLWVATTESDRREPAEFTERHFQGFFRPAVDEGGKPIANTFTDRDGLHYAASNALFAAIAAPLSRAYPATLTMQELIAIVAQQLGPTNAADMAFSMLQMMVRKGSVAVLADASVAARQVPAKPWVHPFTRAQLALQRTQEPGRARHTAWSLIHTELEIDAFGSWLATQLDGTRDVQALAQRALDAVNAGERIVPANIGPVTLGMLLNVVPQSLESLRQNGLIQQQPA